MVQFKESSVTKELFSKYVEIQREGKYNMIMDGAEVIALLGCTVDEYKEILKNYDALSKKYGISA
jgi:hypothetical protein